MVAGSVGGRKLLQAPAPSQDERHMMGFGQETLADNREMMIETAVPNITVVVNTAVASSSPLVEEAGAGLNFLNRIKHMGS